METKISRASKALSNGEPARAKRLLEQVLRSDPENIEALWMISRLYESRNSLEDWLASLTRLRELLPDELYIPVSYTHLTLPTKRIV